MTFYGCLLNWKFSVEDSYSDYGRMSARDVNRDFLVNEFSGP